MQAKQPGPILCPAHKADRTNVVMSRSPLRGVVPYGTESRRRFYPPAWKPSGLEAEPEARTSLTSIDAGCVELFSRVKRRFDPFTNIGFVLIQGLTPSFLCLPTGHTPDGHPKYPTYGHFKILHLNSFKM